MNSAQFELYIGYHFTYHFLLTDTFENLLRAMSNKQRGHRYVRFFIAYKEFAEMLRTNEHEEGEWTKMKIKFEKNAAKRF